MKKIIAVLVSVMFITQSAVFAEYWKAKSLYYKFDFTNEKYPEFTAISGNWNVDLTDREKKITEDFEYGCGGFSPVSGEWSVQDGRYLQNQEGISSLTRSMYYGTYKNFVLSFDAFPQSEENTLIIFFGYKGEEALNSIEINSYKSALIIGGNEFIGKGNIVKDKEYKISLVVNSPDITLYCDDEVIFAKSGLEEKTVKLGIGTWNSRIAFDNFEIENIPSLGLGKKLTGSGKGKNFAVFPELFSDNFVINTTVAASSIYSGTMGIAARVAENTDGYYAGINKNSAYIAKKISGKNQILKKEIFKPQSNIYYDISVICDGNNISLIIDGENIVSAADTDFDKGMCGLYSEDITIYCKNITMQLAETVSPPVISDGSTVYYIDAACGNDFNDGKTTDTAWKSLGKLHQCSFASGDSILLKRGLEYDGTVFLNNITADTPIKISSYGDGNIPKINPCGIGISIDGCSGIEISDLEVNLRHYGADNNLWIGQGYGIFVKNSDNIIISDCILNGPGADTYTFAIEADDKDTFDEITLENVHCTNFGIDKITVKGETLEKQEELNSAHWAYKYMKALKRKNIITEYRFDDKVTRAEFAAMLTSALSLTQSEYRTIFKDVADDAWYAGKIITISDYRILPPEMTPGGLAKPNAPILRQEAAAIAALAAGAEITGTGEYSDLSECDEWAAKYIKSVTDMGIMSGNGDGSFNPKGEVSRAQAAVILTKLMKYIGGNL